MCIFKTNIAKMFLSHLIVWFNGMRINFINYDVMQT